MNAKDPRDIVDNAPMSRAQIVAVAIMVGLNALDGFDVLSISFASPGIAAEWGIDRVALGAVLSMELIGMAVGSLVLGGVADRVGRQRTILGCLAVMALGMAMVTQAGSITELSIWRVLTGLGIGGMLASINAVTAEFANARRRTIAMGLMVIGYPLGAVIGGLISAELLVLFDWRAIFWFGSLLTACFIPLVWAFAPETAQYLLVRRGPHTLERINRLMARFGHGPVSALPPEPSGKDKPSLADIFRPGLLATTVLVTFAYFAHIVSFYFILKWTPKIVVDIGFPAPEAAGVLVAANLGGAIGGGIFGFAVQKLPLKGATIAMLFGSALMIALFGASGVRTLAGLSALVFVSGLFTNSAVSGLYVIFARSFPTHVRATGTGFAIGIGRGGAALSPILAGVLFEAGFSLPWVSTLIAMGSLFAAFALITMRFRPRD